MKTILILWALGCSAVAFAQLTVAVPNAAVPSVVIRTVDLVTSQGTTLQVSIPDCEQTSVPNKLEFNTTCMTQSNQLARYRDGTHISILSDSARALFLSRYEQHFSTEDLDL